MRGGGVKGIRSHAGISKGYEIDKFNSMSV